VTVLPAVLSLLGDRVERGRPALWVRTALRRPARAGSGRGGRWVGTVLKPVIARPRTAVALGVGGLVLLALPVTTMNTAELTVSQQAPGTPIAVAYERIAEAFPTGP